MSEWLGKQKQSNSNFRKLLQERIEKANPLRKAREAAELGELDALIEQQAQFGRRLTLKNK